VNDTELVAAVNDANGLLQQIQNYAGRENRQDARVRFPRGFLRTTQEARAILPFVRKGLLKKNLAYSILLDDVYRWILMRTDLSGIAADMVMKAHIALKGSVAEALLVDHYAGIMGKRQPFAKRTARLVADSVISEELKTDLDWLWEVRCQQHLYELDISEFDAYDRAYLVRATRAVNGLIAALSAAHAAGR
jgi:hypothetical protein